MIQAGTATRRPGGFRGNQINFYFLFDKDRIRNFVKYITISQLTVQIPCYLHFHSKTGKQNRITANKWTSCLHAQSTAAKKRSG